MSTLPPIKWSRYIPPTHSPTPKQIAFLYLPHREALYGGAASGGKTEALCMDALRWFDTPGFSCIIFRRKLTDHKLKSSCLNRILEWLAPWIESGDVKYYSGEHTLRSKEGGTITFGYIDKEGSKERYMSSEYHLVIFDELTHFSQEEYIYLFSRLRRTTITSHIAVRMRAGTNPGNRGHAWVRKRFGIEKHPGTGEWLGSDPTRPFIQAKVGDNPHVDRKLYELNLGELDPVNRDRLRDGDWSASEDALFKIDWFQHRWRRKQEFYILTDGEQLRSFHESKIFLFTTVDTACSEGTGTQGKVYKPNQEPSFNAAGCWGLAPPPHFDLLWIDNIRGKWPVGIYANKVVELHRAWHPAFSMVESNTIGAAMITLLRGKGITVHPQPSVTDKVARSIYAQVAAEKGKIWLPESAVWLPDLEDELFVWTGKRGEVADQIDNLSSAAYYRSQKAQGCETEPGVRSGRHISRPVARGGLKGSQGLSSGLGRSRIGNYRATPRLSVPARMRQLGS